MRTEEIRKEVNKAMKEDVYKKEYTIQDKVLKWRPLNFHLVADCEKLKISYEQFETKYLKDHLGEDKKLLNDVMEVMKGFKPEELQKIILQTDGDESKELIKTAYLQQDQLSIRLIRETLSGQMAAKELFVLEDGVIQKLVKTCLAGPELDYNITDREKINELLSFGKELRDDFFIICDLKPGRLYL